MFDNFVSAILWRDSLVSDRKNPLSFGPISVTIARLSTSASL